MQNNAFFGKKIASKFESPIYFNSLSEWKPSTASIFEDKIMVGGKAMALSEVTKIKVMRESGPYNSLKIKLTYQSHDVLFSVDRKERCEGMPLHYYWFAKIINYKLHLKGFSWETHIPETYFRNSNAYNLIVDGNLFKKSQYLKAWETRYVAMTPEGLSSYKKDTGF